MAAIPARAPRPGVVHRQHGVSATIATALAGAALLLAVVPATATQFSRSEHYTDDYAFSIECGPGEWIDVVGHSSGVAHIRAGTGDDASAFFLHDNFEFRDVATSRTSGDFLVISGNALFHETNATRVSGTIFEFNSVYAGQPFVVRDSDGNLILRDRGVVRETIQFDTLGDDTPGGTFITSVSFEVAGPHPGLFFDPCPILY